MVEEVQGHVLWYLVQTCSAVLLVRSSLTPPGGGALAWWLCSAEWQAKGDGRQKEMAQSGLYPSSMGQAIISAWLQSQVHASGSSQLQPWGPGQAVQQSTRHNDDPDPWAGQSQDQGTDSRQQNSQS